MRKLTEFRNDPEMVEYDVDVQIYDKGLWKKVHVFRNTHDSGNIRRLYFPLIGVYTMLRSHARHSFIRVNAYTDFTVMTIPAVHEDIVCRGATHNNTFYPCENGKLSTLEETGKYLLPYRTKLVACPKCSGSGLMNNITR